MRPRLKDERLFWRGGVIWCRVPTPGSGRKERKSTHCKSEAAAVIRADEFERRYASTSHAAAAKKTFGSIADALIADMVRREKSDATIKKANQKLGHFIRLWGAKMPLAEISAQLVMDYVDQRRSEGVVNFTIKMELEHLAMALRIARHLKSFFLTNEEVLPPFFTANHSPRKRAPTIEEVQALFENLTRHRAAHLAFILATGARLGEALRARRSDVNWSRRIVTIRGTKTKLSAGEVPITPLMESILAWSLERAPGKDLLFHPWGKLHRDVAAACERAGIPYLTPNDLRRAFGKWHAQNGISIQQISKLLRHSTDKLAQTTYANLGASDLGKLIDDHFSNVSKLYPAAVETGETGAPSHRETVEKAAPAGVVETPTNALGKRSASLSEIEHRNPRKIGNQIAWAKRHPKATVPDPYPEISGTNTEKLKGRRGPKAGGADREAGQ